MFRRQKHAPLADRGPLRVLFVLTSMPVGGAETALVEVIRRMDRGRFLPELCCLKYLDVLGEQMAGEMPVFTGLLANKYDFRVLPRLVRQMRRRRIDAVVTGGTGGDKMFWGRLAGWFCDVPVICSALHSTGLPDHVEFSNRLLAPVTDAFVAVARTHGEYLAAHEGCPAKKIVVVPNGVDVERFHPRWPDAELQRALGLSPSTPAVGIIAALRPEKNHEMFLAVAAMVRQRLPDARFLIVGDGPRREALEAMARRMNLAESVQFLGTRGDVPTLLALMDVVVLTSHMEANPISLLEALASEKPVVAPRVGSVPETVLDGRTGYLVAPGDAKAMADRVVELLTDRNRAESLGRAGREHVIAHGSVDRMVRGYEDMIEGIYAAKCGRGIGGLGEQGKAVYDSVPAGDGAWIRTLPGIF